MIIFRTCHFLRITAVICGLLFFSGAYAQQRLLVFTKTSGYRHNSINNGLSAIQQMGNSGGFEVVSTENANDFNFSYLSGFNAVVFLSTTGDVLNNTQQAEFEKYIQSGGGYVGVHAATDCEYSWPWYGKLVGAWFNGHPDIQNATLYVTDNSHPSTSGLPSPWQRTDEWYNFGNFQSNVNVLLRIDENSYSGGTMGSYHPIAWYHNFDGGRSWYTALGHTESTFSEQAFLSHLAGGIQFAMGSGTVNKAPSASAGANQTITLPVNSVTLNGSGTDSDGSITTYKWTKVSGPSGGNISSPDNASTGITGMNEGIYVFRLTVTDDDGSTGSDDVQIQVNPAPQANAAPSASAGANQTITLPVNTVTLNGSGTDSDGSITTYKWTKVSGPSGGNISSQDNASTAITGMNEGTYVFRLTVTDNDGATGSDDVQIQVNPAPQANAAPSASAGANQTITLPVNTVTLNGSGTDSDGSITTYKWTKVSGPSGGNISSPDNASTGITGMNEGTYVFRLTVTDNDGATGTDDVEVKVNAAVPPPNVAPVASAGTDKVITLPVNSVSLGGSGTDTDGSIVSYSWQKVSGPSAGGGAIQSPSNSATNVSGLKEGIYVFRLTVTDNDGATDSDDVQVKVNAALLPPNASPKANAGSDKTISLPVNTTTLTGSATDEDGTVVSWKWTRISGPVAGGGAIASPDNKTTTVSDLKAGTYVFRLTVSDEDGATAYDDIQVKVNAAPAPSNAAPRANAGADKTITLPTSSVSLSGTGTDSDGSIVSWLWTKISGPASGGGTIQSPASALTNVTGLKEGIYVFRLTVTDNKGAAGSDDIQVKVNAGPPAPNKTPVANAGSDIILTLPDNSVTLNGSNSADSDGVIKIWEWIKLDGPVAGVLSGGNTSRLNLAALEPGVYQFRLVVTDDDGAVSYDDVTVTVFDANELPVARTKDTITLILPVQNTELDASASSDPDGTIDSVKWSYVKGPRRPIMLSPDKLKNIVTDLVPGTYEFRVTITDNRGGKSSAKTVVIVKNSSARRLIPTIGLYPNPAQPSVTLTIDAEIDGRMQVTFYDLYGRAVLQGAYQKNTRILQQKFNIAHLSKGVYMVEIVIERAEKVVRKLVKQ